MNRKVRQIAVNLIIFLIIGGFIWYVVSAMNKDEV